MRLEALEVPFEIWCAGSGAAELATSVGEAWEWCAAGASTAPATAGTASRGTTAVTSRPQRVTAVLERDPGAAAAPPREGTVRGGDLATVMDRLSPLITRLAVTERRTDLVMFHACAVADPATGDTVVLYGPSGTGKTTLARTLCTDLVYLSDETAGVDRDLRVVPYLKPLSIIVKPGDHLKEQVSPGRLGLVRPGGIGYRLRALVQLQRDPQHGGEAVLEPLATVEALPELMAQTSYTREMERPLHTMADLVHRVGGVLRATYAEAEQLRAVVRGILDGGA